VKKLLCLVAAVMVSASVQAQSYYRWVQGKPISKREMTTITEHLKVVSFSGQAVICERYTTENVPVTKQLTDPFGKRYVGQTMETRIHPMAPIVLTNYPNAHRLDIGAEIPTPIVALRIGSAPFRGFVEGQEGVRSYRASGVEMAVYDYGVDYYFPAPVRKSVSQLTGGTNGPSATNTPTVSAPPKPDDVQKRTFVHWNEKAEKGDEFAMYRVGVMYLKGEGVEKDLWKARAMLNKAAALGCTEAEEELRKLPAVDMPAQTNSSPAEASH
jgi:hypothetical protein